MKQQHTFLFFISILLISIASYTQEVKKDTIILKDTYGLRVGIDLYNPIYTIIDNSRKGLELVGDFRISKKYYIAAELGYLNNETDENYYDFKTEGQYIKLGVNYNLYQNWLHMDNDIYFGLRYGISTFSQTVDNATVNSDVVLPEHLITKSKEYKGLNANWGELVVGMKAEIFKNIYLGFSASLKKMISSKEPENFKNLVVPGFNRVFLNDGGFGFNYTLSYRLPLYKKNKIEKTEEETIEKEKPLAE